MQQTPLKTTHHYMNQDSKTMGSIPDQSIDLIVTSPPYPMIEMWDMLFFSENPEIKNHLLKGEAASMFEAMHRCLDPVWKESFRVLKTGGFLCVNIGDATRTVNNQFHLFSNHARILTCLIQTGFTVLPAIIWRKQTNAPNKFMGSGMLPAGAYVTLEHEYILIVRKGKKREFKTEREKENRHESAFFWEERNLLFSDVWMDLKGARQRLENEEGRKRSGAYPFELAYRLINMYSVKGDLVLDPFMGTGTTALAAMAANRNSTGFEIDAALTNIFSSDPQELLRFLNSIIEDRIGLHLRFVAQRLQDGKPFKHQNTPYGFPVVTNQEKRLFLNPLQIITRIHPNGFEVHYHGALLNRYDGPWEGPDKASGKEPLEERPTNGKGRGRKKKNPGENNGFTQMTLF